MIPTDFNGSNLTLVKPDNMTDEECGSLYCLHRLVLDAYGAQISHAYTVAYKASKEDCETLKKGGCIGLSLMSSTEKFITFGTTVDAIAGYHLSKNLTAWIPSPIDLRNILNGGNIYITILGESFPPIKTFTCERDGTIN